MIAILIGASHDTLKSGFVPLQSGSYRFTVEGLVDSHYIVEHNGMTVRDKAEIMITDSSNIRLLRIKEGTERMKINIHLERI